MTVKTIEAQPAEKKKLRVAEYCRVSMRNSSRRIRSGSSSGCMRMKA